MDNFEKYKIKYMITNSFQELIAAAYTISKRYKTIRVLKGCIDAITNIDKKQKTIVQNYIADECCSFSNIERELFVPLVKEFTDCKIYDNSYYGRIKVYKNNNITCILQPGFNNSSELYVKRSFKDKVRNELVKYLYSTNKNIIIQSKGKIAYSQQQKFKNPIETENYLNIKQYLSDFKNKNENRSILLYGNPGVGKSYISAMIMKGFDFNWLRFVKFTDMYEILDICKILKPNGIIFDDFDKIDLSKADILDVMEELKRTVPVVIYTANDIDFMKKFGAIMRPGRIDKFFEINSIDKRTVLNLIGKENEDIYGQIKEFPIAFIEECRAIMNVYGKQYLIDNLDELKERAKNNTQKVKDSSNNSDDESDSKEIHDIICANADTVFFQK
jgi:hypothetical protein